MSEVKITDLQNNEELQDVYDEVNTDLHQYNIKKAKVIGLIRTAVELSASYGCANYPAYIMHYVQNNFDSWMNKTD